MTPGDTLSAGLEQPSAELDGAWRRLASRCGRASLFNSPEMIDAWRASLGAGRSSGIIAVRRGQGLVAVLPVMRVNAWRSPGFNIRYDYDPADAAHLVERRRSLIPVRQLSPVHSLAATALQPALLCQDEDVGVATSAIAAWLAKAPGWDQMILPCFEGAESDAWLAALGSAGLDGRLDRIDRSFRSMRPVISVEDILSGTGKKFRQNVSRARKAGEADGLSISVDFSEHSLTRAMPAVAALAAASWKATAQGERDVFVPFEGRQQAFFEALAEQVGAGMAPLVLTAHLDGTPTAILVGTLSANGVMTLLLLFRDGRAAAASPGLLLVLAAIGIAEERKLAAIDFNATADWVRHLVNDTRVVQNVTCFSRGVRGRAYAALRTGVAIAVGWRRGEL